MAINYDVPMDFTREDKNGHAPDTKLVGATYRHWKSGRTYRIIAFVWLGDTDEWGVAHADIDDHSNPPYSMPNLFVRSVTNFFGLANVPRMSRVVTPE